MSGKDPAVLWYFDNWAGGTATMTRHLKGCYMDLLNAQFNSGHLSIEEIKTVLGSDFGSSWPTIQKKFDRDKDGLFFSKRLEAEKTKRSRYKAGRLENLEGSKTDEYSVGHMGNGNKSGIEIENSNGNTVEIRRKNFYEKVGAEFYEKYPKEMLLKFCNYWTEHNEGGNKMKFEMQKVFNISMRLTTWSNNNFGNNGKQTITNEGLLGALNETLGRNP